MVRVGPGAAGLVDASTLGLPAKEAPPQAALIVPHHGPIIQAPDAAGKAFSVRWTGHEDATQDLSAFLGLDTARDVAEAMTAVNDWATGAQNFVLADDQGNIGYNPHALVAEAAVGRNHAGHAAAPPLVPAPGRRLGGVGDRRSRPQLRRLRRGRAHALCWIASADLPQAVGSADGFLITANADPVGTSNNLLAPFGVPVDVHGNYLSFGWDDSTAFRHARITERMKQALTAGGGKVSAGRHGVDPDRPRLAHGRGLLPLHRRPAGGQRHPGVRGRARRPDGLEAGGLRLPERPARHRPGHQPARPRRRRLRRLVRLLPLPRVRARAAHQRLRRRPGPGRPVGWTRPGGEGHAPHAGEPGPAPTSPSATTSTRRARSHRITCEAQVVAALDTAFNRLYAQHGNPTAGGWLWGRVHTFQPVSQFPLVTLGYEPGPFARPGGAFTVDVASPSLSGAGASFAYRSSANVRHVSVMDPAAPVVRMQLPGPEVSRPYGVTVAPDLLTDWARNTYFDYAHGNQILDSTVATQQVHAMRKSAMNSSRVVLLAALLLAAAACTPSIPKEAPPASVVTAIFDPVGGDIPLPSNLLFQNVDGLPVAAAQKDLLKLFMSKGGFPSDQELAITISLAEDRINADGSTTRVAPTINPATFTAESVLVMRLNADGTASEVPLDPVQASDLVAAPATVGAGQVTVLSLHHKGRVPWEPGSYAALLRGGPAASRPSRALPSGPPRSSSWWRRART